MPLATILAVDDTADVLELTSSILIDAGYAVLGCDGSQQAFALLQNGHAVDLLLTDIMMPDVDGFELARMAKAMQPSLLIAYISGYVEIAAQARSEVLGPILRKPYRRDDLTRPLQELLKEREEREDARLLRAVALEMMRRHANALELANEAAELERVKGDELSAHAWQDIAETIAALSA
jgi:CheY-like chemotaxis protein